jgi:hypothetical protein
VKSGKDKTGYMLFGTRWKEGRDGFAPYDNAQVFVRFSLHDNPPSMAYARFRLGRRIRPSGPIHGEETMTLDPVLINPLIALIAGILILLMPRLLNYVVAIYLIAIGIIGLAHHFQ